MGAGRAPTFTPMLGHTQRHRWPTIHSLSQPPRPWGGGLLLTILHFRVALRAQIKTDFPRHEYCGNAERQLPAVTPREHQI